MRAPDPQLMTLLRQAVAAASRGAFAQAEPLYRQARAMAPTHPDIAIGLGHVLRHLRRPTEAKSQFTAALQLDPASAKAHYGMGQACQDMMDGDGAEAAYRAALACDPTLMPAIMALASLFNMTERPDKALALLAGASAPDARLGAAIEQLRGAARLIEEDHDAALGHFERALALDPGHGEAAFDRATAQQALGRDEEAVETLRRLVKDQPAHLAAHDALNRLLYRLGREGEFLRSYDEAAARFPAAPHFLLAKAAHLVRAERHAEALALYDQALQRAPGEPVVLQGRATAQLKLGQVDAAIASYAAGLKRAPQDLNMLTGIAAAYLTAREPRKAEAAAVAALRLAPTDQAALSMLGTAWRLMDDGRADDLYRHDDFIQILELEPPPGFGDMTDFCATLDDWLTTQHRDRREHLDQSLRGGTQTMGDLLRPGRHPLLDALRLRIEEALRLYIGRLPQEPHHPFLGRRGRDMRLAGSWSSRLTDQGFHANHLHTEGWISSAFYVALPETVHDQAGQQGWLQFGVPSYDVGLAAPVCRVVQPGIGRLVLFPSYMWHGTVPFRGTRHRTTIAFDAVPVGAQSGKSESIFR